MSRSRLFDMSTFNSAVTAINSRGFMSWKLAAIIFALVLVPVMFPGIFIPQALIAGTPAQLALPEDVFNNLKFENREAFEAQINQLIASYERKLAAVAPDSEIAKVFNSRIKTAQALLASVTDDMFVGNMVKQATRVPAAKPYFGYSVYGHAHRCCAQSCQTGCNNGCHCRCHAAHKITRTRVDNLGRWASRTEKEAADQNIAEYVYAFPAVIAAHNEGRAAKIDETMKAAIEENKYVPNFEPAVSDKEIKETKEIKKAARKHKKFNRKHRKARKASAPVPAPAPAPAK